MKTIPNGTAPGTGAAAEKRLSRKTGGGLESRNFRQLSQLRRTLLLREVFYQNSNVMIAALQRIRSALIRAAIYIASICQGLT
jgi:hypothetical protein